MTKLHDGWIYHRGDIYYADLDPCRGSEQGGYRPVLVLQNDAGIFYAPTLIIAPITSVFMKRADLPSHYHIGFSGGLIKDSMVLLEQMRTIDKHRIHSYVGRVSKKQMEEIDDTIRVTLKLPVYEVVEAP